MPSASLSRLGPTRKLSASAGTYRGVFGSVTFGENPYFVPPKQVELEEPVPDTLGAFLQGNRVPTDFKSDSELLKATLKYPALRITTSLYYLASWLVGIAAVIAAIFFLADEQLVFAVGAAVVGFLWVVSMIAAAELIKVFLDAEENTRNCYSVLRQMVNKR
jgi:CHASE2 domain-containing sensor protein